MPAWLGPYLRELDTEVRLSACGHQNSCNAGESDTLSSVEVAEKLNRSERWVRRHPDLLGGEKHGDRWRYSRATVEEYAAGRASA
ncbi:helix-turn-helix domain-containing protein [Mycobacterium sp. 050272]|uniref:helix-turn-helix domain-containing protein n=1 Tax=Mycobacterium sp. 050272 TaxID=3142488 RepID=UPI00319608BB